MIYINKNVVTTRVVVCFDGTLRQFYNKTTCIQLNYVQNSWISLYLLNIWIGYPN